MFKTVDYEAMRCLMDCITLILQVYFGLDQGFFSKYVKLGFRIAYKLLFIVSKDAVFTKMKVHFNFATIVFFCVCVVFVFFCHSVFYFYAK